MNFFLCKTCKINHYQSQDALRRYKRDKHPKIYQTSKKSKAIQKASQNLCEICQKKFKCPKYLQNHQNLFKGYCLYNNLPNMSIIDKQLPSIKIIYWDDENPLLIITKTIVTNHLLSEVLALLNFVFHLRIFSAMIIKSLKNTPLVLVLLVKGLFLTIKQTQKAMQ